MDFVRWPSVVHLTDAEFDALAPVAIRLAEAEGLPRARGGDPRAHAGPANVMTTQVRTATTQRDTQETQISATVSIDGTGAAVDHAAAALLQAHDRGLHEVQRHGRHARGRR